MFRDVADRFLQILEAAQAGVKESQLDCFGFGECVGAIHIRMQYRLETLKIKQIFEF